jgi:indolepyruvate ferredoxin oxidoreductase alpha subunit
MGHADVLLDREGKDVLLLGNEAIARGLLEGGVQVAASYPGTPSVEIMATLVKASRRFGIYAEWSVNEKVAAEVAIAASISGLRSMVSMKGVGVNVASEPMQAFTYMGARGGMVMISADDPSCHSSHNEQDNRLFARQAYLPVFEPSNPEEARRMAKAALDLSEEWGQPTLLRTTTRVSHASGCVTLGSIERKDRKGTFERNRERWVNLPANARRMRLELLERMEKITEAVDGLPFNRLEGDGGELGVIVAGAPYGPVVEALRILGAEDSVRLLKIGTPYPIPEKTVTRLLESVDGVLVVEEVEPFVQMQVGSLANREGLGTPVVGKEHLPTAGELNLHTVLNGLRSFLGLPAAPVDEDKSALAADLEAALPPRPPVLCAGCGHRNAFLAMNLAARKLRLRGEGGLVRPSDIGCYTLGYGPPLDAVDTNFCMGASIGISSGLSKTIDNPIVCTIGDSTFFHAGIPPLLNAVTTGADITVLILDNGTTAMTGYQPHPGVGKRTDGNPTKRILIEDMARAAGVEDVRVVDVHDLPALTEALAAAIQHEGVSVVVARGPCAILEARERAKAGEVAIPCYVDEDACTGCLLCITRFGCPAFYISGDIVRIDPALCTGCAVCMDSSVCAVGAIGKGA